MVPQKFIYVSKNRSSFSRVSLKSKTKDAHPWLHKQAVLFCLRKTWFSENKNLTSNNLKMNNFMFNVKQLKINKFIKFIWQLIISTSNATLEVPLLRPCRWYSFKISYLQKIFLNSFAIFLTIYIIHLTIITINHLTKSHY